MAQKSAWRSAKDTGSLMPPKNILNAPTKLMKQVGYGRGYQYDHDAPEGFSGDNYWPEEMEPETFYTPVDRGFDKRTAERLAWWETRHAELRKSNVPRRKAGARAALLRDHALHPGRSAGRPLSPPAQPPP